VIADAVVDAVLGTRQAAVAAGAVQGVKAPGEVASGAGLLLGLLDALQPRVGAPDVDAAVVLVARETPVSVRSLLDRLDRGSRSAKQVLAAVALALRTTPLGKEVSIHPVTKSLLGAVWVEGAWACADVLSRGCADEAAVPGPFLAEALAAPRERARYLLSAATGSPPMSDDAIDLLRVSTCLGLLRDEIADPDVVELLKAWDGTGRTTELTRAALDY